MEVFQIHTHNRYHRNFAVYRYVVNVLKAVIRFKFLVQYFFSFLCLGSIHNQPNSSFRRTLGNNPYIDVVMSQRSKNSRIHPYFSQQTSTFEIHQSHLFLNGQGSNIRIMRISFNSRSRTGRIKGVFDVERNVLLNQRNNGFCMKNGSSKIGKLVGLLVGNRIDKFSLRN